MIKLKELKLLIEAADDFMPILIFRDSGKISSDANDFNCVKYDEYIVDEFMVEDENNRGATRACLIFLKDDKTSYLNYSDSTSYVNASGNYYDNIPSSCVNCSNHPSNGGSGNCNCMLGQMPVTYTGGYSTQDYKIINNKS